MLFVLQPQRIKVLYWKQKQPGHEAQNFPTLIIDGLTGAAFAHSYGLPCLEYPNHVKVGQQKYFIYFTSNQVKVLQEYSIIPS